MGANAGTAVPVYASGEVLTAARLNLTNCGVPVFSGTATRDAAFGGSGEKVLAEGQLAYLEDANVVQYYDGAVWATVGPQTLTSGLNYITGATFTTATSVSAVNDTFTSTYRNYRIVINFTACATNTVLTLRLRAAGTDISTALYYNTQYTLVNSGAAGTVNTATQTSWEIGALNTLPILGGITIDVLSPQATDYTTGLLHSHTSETASAAQRFRIGGLQYYATTSADSFTIISSAASAMSGQYRVYGYANS